MPDNETIAPIIPQGTVVKGGAAYNPLVASQQASQGNGQAQNSPSGGQSESEGRQDAQQSSVNQASQQVTEGEITYEALAAKKGFKSADDLARAYANLEVAKTRSDMSLGELIKLKTETQEQVEASQQIPADVQSKEDAMKVIEQTVRKFTKPLEEQIALQNLFARFPDATSFAAEMGKIVKESPGISWEHAYKIAKSDSAEKSAFERGRQEALKTGEQKQSLQQSSKGGSVQRDGGRSLQELIADRSIPFSEVQRIMKERFSK